MAPVKDNTTISDQSQSVVGWSKQHRFSNLKHLNSMYEYSTVYLLANEPNNQLLEVVVKDRV